HYDVSTAIGERDLLPRVRGASKETLILADGYSCRTQIEQGTGRGSLHLAEVLARGLDDRGIRHPSGHEERTKNVPPRRAGGDRPGPPLHPDAPASPRRCSLVGAARPDETPSWNQRRERGRNRSRGSWR